MGFRQSIVYSVAFGYIAECHTNITELLLCKVIQPPLEDAHHRTITKWLHSLWLEFWQKSFMVLLMTRLTQCNQVVWRISTNLPTLNVVNIKDTILGLSFATLASVLVPCKDILTNIPKPILYTLLIANSLNCIVLHLLRVKTTNLQVYLRYRQDLVKFAYNRQVSVDFVFHAWRQPAFSFPWNSVVKPRLAMP